MNDKTITDMKNFTPADGLLLFLGIVLGKLGSFVGGMIGPALLLTWYQSDLFRLLVGGFFSIAGICLGKIVEVEWKERIQRRRISRGSNQENDNGAENKES